MLTDIMDITVQTLNRTYLISKAFLIAVYLEKNITFL